MFSWFYKTFHHYKQITFAMYLPSFGLVNGHNQMNMCFWVCICENMYKKYMCVCVCVYVRGKYIYM